MKGHDKNGLVLSDNEAMAKVIAANSKAAALQKEIKALRKDREQMMSEFQDIIHARKVRVSPSRGRKINGDSVEVDCADIHGMVQDKDAVAAFLRDVKRIQPDHIMLGGDVITCDGWLSKWQPLYVSDLDYTYQEDIGAGNDFLDALQKAAPNSEIEMLEGNHEWHIERYAVDQTGNKRDAQFLMSLFGPAALLKLKERGITYYRRSVVHVKNAPPGWVKRGKIWYVHQAGGGRNAAASSLGNVAGNLVYYDTHREDAATKTFVGVGLCKAFNPGCMCGRYPLYNHTKPNTWSQGYGLTYVSKSGNFQRMHVPIWNGDSLAGSMIDRFRVSE